MARDAYGKHFEELEPAQMEHLKELVALALIENEEIQDAQHS